MRYRRINDGEIGEVFAAAKKIRNNKELRENPIVGLARKAALRVLDYYGCDPTVPKIDLSQKRDRKIIVDLFGKVFENILIKEGLA